MRGIIKSFARSVGRINAQRAVVQVDGVNSRNDAIRLSGRQVVLRHGKNIFSGKIVSHHGDAGKLHVRFRKPIPAQALRQQVEIK